MGKGRIQKKICKWTVSSWKDVQPRWSFSSVQFSHSVVSDSLQPQNSQHARPSHPSPTPRVHSNSCPSSRWCHPAISTSVVPFSSCLQSFPASGSFPMSQFFTSGKIPWRRKWQPTPVFLPGKSHGPWSLVGYCPWGRKESDMTEWFHFLSFFPLFSEMSLLG